MKTNQPRRILKNVVLKLQTIRSNKNTISLQKSGSLNDNLNSFETLTIPSQAEIERQKKQQDKKDLYELVKPILKIEHPIPFSIGDTSTFLNRENNLLNLLPENYLENRF